MANLRKSTPVSFAYPNPSPSSRWVAGDRAKRRKVECSHPVILARKCLLCGRAVFDGDDRSLPFGFLHPSLRLSREYADRMREASTRAALGLKKLHLVLDLDHTLLHTVRLSDLTPEEEERLKPEAERNTEGAPAGGGGGGGDIFFVGSETGEGFITKLRPFVREFLREAQEMFQLMVYTMGGRVYSSRMTKLLDPDGDYFSDRVITREDCTVRGRKSLEVVLAKASNVLIVDDTETVWPDHAENLISIEPFWYFSHGSEKRSVRPSFGHNEDDDTLATALRILKEIHQGYFDSKPGLKGGDVRDLVRRMPSLVCHTSRDQAPPGDA